jgi:enoyl-[acyl-carrier-protein] reductase (NADH)
MHPVEAHEFLKQLSPLKRLAEVREVADLLLYLESVSFLNGEVVHLDGGAHALPVLRHLLSLVILDHRAVRPAQFL